MQFVLDRVKMLQHYKVTPIMVFDGANLPSKAGTEHDRHSSRAENKAKGMQALRSDNRSAAVEYFHELSDGRGFAKHDVTASALEALETKQNELEAESTLSIWGSMGSTLCVWGTRIYRDHISGHNML